MSSPETSAAPPRNGIPMAVACYGIWGLLPLYFHLVDNVGPVEIIAHRVIWSLFLLLFLIAGRSGLGAFGAVLRDRRLMLPLAVSAMLIAANWLIYIWAVHRGHVIGASLGYFLNPLVNILLGYLFLKERLRTGQMAAVAFAGVGVAVLAVEALNTLWISLSLAFTFGFYGLIRKVTPVQPMRGLGAETLILTPAALGYLVWMGGSGGMVFGGDAQTSLLLVALGGLTTLPLLLFAMAAQRLSLATLGVLQYIAPTLQFLTGVLVFGEALNSAQMLSFGLIWVGLILFTIDTVRASRAARMVVAPV